MNKFINRKTRQAHQAIVQWHKDTAQLSGRWTWHYIDDRALEHTDYKALGKQVTIDASGVEAFDFNGAHFIYQMMALLKEQNIDVVIKHVPVSYTHLTLPTNREV